MFVCARVIRWCNIDVILFQKFTMLDSWRKYHSVGCSEIRMYIIIMVQNVMRCL